MEENMTTLNTSEEITDSSAVADKPSFNPDSTGLIYDRNENYTEIDPSDKTLTQEATEKDKGKQETKEAADETRFDKHPRWQEIKQERDQAKQLAEQERIERARLEGELNALRQQSAKVSEQAPAAPLTYKDISALTTDEIAEWQVTDPKGFVANVKEQAKQEALREARETLRAEQVAEKQRTTIEQTYREFEAKNPDFKQMWDSGAIMKFIDANPAYSTPISAYQAMTFESRMQKAVDEARQKAIKETEEAVNKNWKAKQQTRVLGAGPAGRGNTDENEFKNIKEKGGIYNFLANRLDKLRAAS